MLLSQIFEGYDSGSFLTLVGRALAGSAPAITQFLATEPEQLARFQHTITQGLRAKDRDTIDDVYSILNDLQSTGHINSPRDVKTIRQLFGVVRQAIGQQRVER
ncbi:hypothetical protein D3C75_821690 [compost metagenome]